MLNNNFSRMKELLFLRYCLNIIEECPVLSSKEWEEVFFFLKKHAIVGIGFDGVERLPSERRPPFNLLMEWIALAGQIEGRNKCLFERCGQLTRIFLKAGFDNCILKGQGNSLMYRNPLRRISGDIDIWVIGSKKDIITFIKSYCQGKYIDINYHHVSFPLWQDVEVEVHYRPSWLCSPIRNYRLQKWYTRQARNQSSYLSKQAFYVPTIEFNLIFQLTHIYNHFIFEGIGLRQIIDYYYLLVNWDGRSSDYLESLMKKFGLLKFASSIMYVIGYVFNFPEERMICYPNPKEGKLLLTEILISGNFGKYDQRNYTLFKKLGIKRKILQFRRSYRFIYLYPEEIVCVPLRIYHVIWRKLKLWKWE